jgi:hypothetical protein
MFAVLGFILLAAWLFMATEPSHPRLIHLLPLAGCCFCSRIFG